MRLLACILMTSSLLQLALSQQLYHRRPHRPRPPSGVGGFYNPCVCCADRPPGSRAPRLCQTLDVDCEKQCPKVEEPCDCCPDASTFSAGSSPTLRHRRPPPPEFCRRVKVDCRTCPGARDECDCCTRDPSKPEFCSFIRPNCAGCESKRDFCECCPSKKGGRLPDFCRVVLPKCDQCPKEEKEEEKEQPLEEDGSPCDCCRSKRPKPDFCKRVRVDCRRCAKQLGDPCDCCGPKFPKPFFCRRVRVDCRSCPKDEEDVDVCDCCGGVTPVPEFCTRIFPDCRRCDRLPTSPANRPCDCCDVGDGPLPSFCAFTTVDCRSCKKQAGAGGGGGIRDKEGFVWQ